MVKSSSSKSSGSAALNPSRDEWVPVFHIVKEGLAALKWMPVMALALAALTLLFNHHDRDSVGPATASCVSCEETLNP
jgi:hypothetical protein